MLRRAVTFPPKRLSVNSPRPNESHDTGVRASRIPPLDPRFALGPVRRRLFHARTRTMHDAHANSNSKPPAAGYTLFITSFALQGRRASPWRLSCTVHRRRVQSAFAGRVRGAR